MREVITALYEHYNIDVGLHVQEQKTQDEEPPLVEKNTMEPDEIEHKTQYEQPQLVEKNTMEPDEIE